MIALGWIALACAALPAILFLRNARAFRPPGGRDDSATVSILIPARDEEVNITAAIDSALANPSAEVLVLDDHSSDRTYDIVAEIAAREPRVRLLRGEPLPHGWMGKNFACAQLAAAAGNPLLLFIDADVRLAPHAAAALAHALRASCADLISGVPRQEVRTLSEQLLIPLIHFVLLGFLPLDRMRRSNHPAYATGCGQLIMADRAAYEAAGGHRAIRASVHDGLTLPKAFRVAGRRTDLVDVTALASCRMYQRDADVWRGLSKNTHEGLGAPARIVPFSVLLMAGQVLPFALLATGMWQSYAGAVLALLPRLLALRRFGQPLLGAVLHPFGIVALVAIQWAGLFRFVRGSTATWKGRACAPAGAQDAENRGTFISAGHPEHARARRAIPSPAGVRRRGL